MNKELIAFKVGKIYKRLQINHQYIKTGEKVLILSIWKKQTAGIEQSVSFFNLSNGKTYKKISLHPGFFKELEP